MRHWFYEGAAKIGTIITLDTPAIAEAVKIAGYDWAWIDGEHGLVDPKGAALIGAILSPQVKSFVRVPDQSPATLKRFLDAGCDGVIVPHVDTRTQLDAIIASCLFPPKGRRSVGIARAQGYGAYLNEAISSRSFAIIAQIETDAGLANAEEIAAAPDLDAVLIGPYDLSGALGMPGDLDAPPVREAIARILAVCKGANLPCGIFAANPARARAALEQGFDFAGVGVDTALLVDAFKATLSGSRERL